MHTAELASDGRYGVFIVEDHSGMRRALRRLLERSPKLHVSGEAPSAEDALAQIGSPPPHLLVVDLNLPGMSGIELIAHLRETHPAARCVVVSAYAEPERKRAAFEAGARGFVSKDDPTEILDTLLQAAEAA